LAEIAGLLHDIKEKGARDGLLNSDEAEIVCYAIQLHEKGYDEIEKECKDPYPLIVACSLIIGDKLFEGSGPRAIERMLFCWKRKDIKWRFERNV